MGRKTKPTAFDVFLAHNSRDKPAIERIKQLLAERGITAWLDKDEIPPGRWFQDLIQAAIPHVTSAAIFLGKQGLGRWQTLEVRAFISQCVERGIPVIPVLLPEANFPANLVFLQELNWVKFEGSVEEAEVLDRLVWGITGKKPPKAATKLPAATKTSSNKTKAQTGSTNKVSNSGDWVMLDDRFFKSRTVNRSASGVLSIHVASAGATDDAFFRPLSPGEYSRGKRLNYAYQSEAGEAVVRELRSETKGGTQTWILDIEPAETRSQHTWGDMTIQGSDGRTYSPEDIATLKARRVLLNEDKPSGAGYGRHMFMESALEVPSGPSVKSLFERFGKKPKDFLQVMRLAMIHRLVAAGVIEHVLELTLALKGKSKMHITFRGQRHKPYSNVQAATIQVRDDFNFLDA